MREIKFRVWNVNEKRWIPQHLFAISAFNGKEEILTYDEDSDRWIVETVIASITQYTGLKDKNGKEIYEGDIVISEWGYGSPQTVVDFDDIIYWRIEGAVDQDTIEIVGNIYETPPITKR